jgi:NTP pyrophosphatase (non-canonical NTP hydrolase)
MDQGSGNRLNRKINSIEKDLINKTGNEEIMKFDNKLLKHKTNITTLNKDVSDLRDLISHRKSHQINNDVNNLRSELAGMADQTVILTNTVNQTLFKLDERMCRLEERAYDDQDMRRVNMKAQRQEMSDIMNSLKASAGMAKRKGSGGKSTFTNSYSRPYSASTGVTRVLSASTTIDPMDTSISQDNKIFKVHMRPINQRKSR